MDLGTVLRFIRDMEFTVAVRSKRVVSCIVRLASTTKMIKTPGKARSEWRLASVHHLLKREWLSHVSF